jgi:hypothetical protein
MEKQAAEFRLIESRRLAAMIKSLLEKIERERAAQAPVLKEMLQKMLPIPEYIPPPQPGFLRSLLEDTLNVLREPRRQLPLILSPRTWREDIAVARRQLGRQLARGMHSARQAIRRRLGQLFPLR